MDYALQYFIEKHIDLIDENTPNSWKRLYNIIGEDFGFDVHIIGSMGKIFLDAGINPCNVLNYVPANFLNGQKEITRFDVPMGCKWIGECAFEDSSIEQITIPSSVNSLEFLSLSGTNLEEIILPDSIENVSSGVFYDCYKLKKADLGQVISLGKDIFANCVELQEVILPNSIRYLQPNAFHNCKKLKRINYKGNIQEFKNIIDPSDKVSTPIMVLCTDGVWEWS